MLYPSTSPAPLCAFPFSRFFGLLFRLAATFTLLFTLLVHCRVGDGSHSNDCWEIPIFCQCIKLHNHCISSNTSLPWNSSCATVWRYIWWTIQCKNQVKISISLKRVKVKVNGHIFPIFEDFKHLAKNERCELVPTQFTCRDKKFVYYLLLFLS